MNLAEINELNFHSKTSHYPSEHPAFPLPSEVRSVDVMRNVNFLKELFRLTKHHTAIMLLLRLCTTSRTRVFF